MVGVDLSQPVLKSANASIPWAHFVAARGEQLPFSQQSFDAVISGVAMPYMEIPRVLAEIARVLKPGGSLWLSLHSFRMVRRHLVRSLLRLDVPDTVYRIYVLLNGLLFHFSGRVFRFPLKRERCESFQTRRGMRIAIRRAGFVDEEVVKFFVSSAIRRDRVSPGPHAAQFASR